MSTNTKRQISPFLNFYVTLHHGPLRLFPTWYLSKIECHNANLVSKDKTEMDILKSKHRPSPCILSHELVPAPDFPPLPLIHTEFQVVIQTHGCTGNPIQKLDWQSLTSLTQFLPSFDTLTFLV